jgi:GDP-L-fucose synthase
MVGSALVRALQGRGDPHVITRDRSALDLTRQSEVERFFAAERIDTVYLAAARVGGIKANNEQPADFIRDNLQIQTNVIACPACCSWAVPVSTRAWPNSPCPRRP